MRVNISRKHYDFRLNSNRKNEHFKIFPIKMHSESNVICHKVGRGQPRKIIGANLVGPTSPMLHTKSQGHWPFGSRRRYLKGLTYMGVVAILVM